MILPAVPGGPRRCLEQSWFLRRLTPFNESSMGSAKPKGKLGKPSSSPPTRHANQGFGRAWSTKLQAKTPPTGPTVPRSGRSDPSDYDSLLLLGYPTPQLSFVLLSTTFTFTFTFANKSLRDCPFIFNSVTHFCYYCLLSAFPLQSF